MSRNIHVVSVMYTFYISVLSLYMHTQNSLPLNYSPFTLYRQKRKGTDTNEKKHDNEAAINLLATAEPKITGFT